MALRNGGVKSDLVDFEFADVKVSNTAFKPLVREAKFDLAEIAIVTYLQAKAYGKPYTLIRRPWSAAASTTPSPTIRNAAR